MENSILQDDSNLRSMEWKDLLKVTSYETVREILLPLPWLLVSWGLAAWQWYFPALLCSFVFFLAGLRVVHGMYHYSTGLSRLQSEWYMVLCSITMLGSMHAIQFNHLRHHKHCLSEDDVEAMSARMSWWRAILLGPIFPIKLCQNALRHANHRQKKWIYFELMCNVIFVSTVFGFGGLSWLKYHVIAMAAGQSLTAFFAVWTVHHDCETEDVLARTIRHHFKSFVTMDMFYHLEHHLFPRVPTCKLHILSQRLDQSVPNLKKRHVF